MVRGITAAYDRQIRESVKDHIHRHSNRPAEPATNASLKSRRPFACVLNETLSPASDAFHPSYAVASRLRWTVEQIDTDNGTVSVGRYTEEPDTADQSTVHVWNHSESSEHAVDTFGVARFIDGHWWFFGDCEPMADRSSAGVSPEDGGEVGIAPGDGDDLQV